MLHLPRVAAWSALIGGLYASGQEAIAHVGVGPVDRCDIEIILPHGKGRLERRDVAANQRLTVTP
jgi:enediyne biosynthesis protein E4